MFAAPYFFIRTIRRLLAKGICKAVADASQSLFQSPKYQSGFTFHDI